MSRPPLHEIRENGSGSRYLRWARERRVTRRSDSVDERTNSTRVTRVDRIHANPSGSRAIADGRERSRRWPTELKISHPMIHSFAVCQDAQPESASPRRSRVCREVARDGLDLETLRTVPSRRLAARSLVADRSRRGSASSARTVQKVKSAKARATKATNEIPACPCVPDVFPG